MALAFSTRSLCSSWSRLAFRMLLEAMTLYIWVENYEVCVEVGADSPELR